MNRATADSYRDRGVRMSAPGDPACDKSPSCPPERRPMVNESLDTLAGRIERLANTASALSKRLDPVSRNEPTAHCGVGEQSCPCALAGTLEQLAGRVGDIDALLEDALNRLEI